MPYIGNTIRAADDYRLIDDISSGFNGSATSFALQVAGSAPVPFPKSPQQILVSVNGVIQEPDPTGASGFNLVGTNIVFSSAPTNGHAFFGIIYATADYLNAGGNFPSGSLGAPSITFIGDENTGYYRKGGGSVGFVSDATEIANFDSNGITISSGNLILGDSSGSSSDRIKLGASGDLELYHNGSDSFIVDQGTGVLVIQGSQTKIRNESGHTQINANNDVVELYYDNSKKFETTSYGTFTSGTHALSGNLDIANDTGRVKLGTSADLQIYHNGNDSYIEDSGTGVLVVKSNTVSFRNAADSEQLAKFIENSSVELYHNNSKKFETTANGADFTVASSGQVNIFGSGGDNGLRISGPQSASSACLFFNTNHNNVSGGTDQYTIQCGGANHTLMFKHTDTTGNTVFELDDTEHVRIPQDNKALKFGASQDLHILHDGNNSLVHNNTGSVIIENDASNANSIFIKAKSGEHSIIANHNGAVELYYDNSKKFETNANGVSIVGTTGSNPTLGINHSDADVTGEVIRIKRTDLPTIRYHSIMAQHGGAASGNFIDFKLHNGSTTTSQSSILKLFGNGLVHVDDNIRFDIGTGSDLHIYHDSNSSVIKNTTGDLFVQSIEDVKLRTNDSEIAVDCVVNDAVKLYYDASLKLETTSTGSKTTGMHLIRGESDIDNQGSPLLFLQSNANTNVKAVFLLEDDYTSGRAMLAINVGESGVTNDRDLVLQKAGGRVGLRGTPTVPVHIHGTTQIEATTTIQGGFLVRKASHASFPYVSVDGNSGSTDFYRQTTAGGIVHFFSDVGGTRTMKSYINENGVLTSASDYRLKTDISEITNGISLVKNLKPSTYKFTHDSTTTHHGFIAHELQEVLPNCVDGDKDAVKEDGTTPDYQFYSDQELVPVLTAALKEAITKIETLETKVAALEAA